MQYSSKRTVCCKNRGLKSLTVTLFSACCYSLKQVGPYTFLENQRKVNITFNADATVDYYQVKSWDFRPELSGGSLEDEIYMPNMIAIAAAESTRWPDALAHGDFPFLRYKD